MLENRWFWIFSSPCSQDCRASLPNWSGKSFPWLSQIYTVKSPDLISFICIREAQIRGIEIRGAVPLKFIDNGLNITSVQTVQEVLEVVGFYMLGPHMLTCALRGQYRNLVYNQLCLEINTHCMLLEPCTSLCPGFQVFKVHLKMNPNSKILHFGILNC
jgi:hypothetical protein